MPSNTSISSSDPLQLILARLEAMQGQLAVLETKSSSISASSHELYMAESVRHTEENHKYRSYASVFAPTEVKTTEAALLQDLPLIRYQDIRRGSWLQKFIWKQ